MPNSLYITKKISGEAKDNWNASLAAELLQQLRRLAI
jgi:hypothetical protein